MVSPSYEFGMMGVLRTDDYIKQGIKSSVVEERGKQLRCII
ncbi:MAG: hypothetical protein ACI9EW_003833 [Cellvibrionaceae bacterium]|jgi:hypothetical protein